MVWQGQLDTLRAVLNRLPDGELINRGTKTGQVARLLLWERRPDSLLRVLSERPPASVIEEQDLFLPVSLLAAWAHELRGDGDEARDAYRTARALLDSVLVVLPDDRRVHYARGLTLAGLGLRDGALEEARWLRESVEYRKDRYAGTISKHHRAQILARVGEAEMALAEIEALLRGPSVLVSAHTLRLDPIWDPLRNHPGFQALLTEYGPVAEGVARP